MKRIIALFLLLALSLSVLASCKKDEDDANGQQEDVESEDSKDESEENLDNEDGKNDGDGLPEADSVDLLNGDLSAYVEIDKKFYASINVIDYFNVLVNNEIIKTLRGYKSESSVDGDGIISVGDIVHIYYKGYYMKNGEPYYFAGGDNTAAEKPHELEIGSGGFIPGFEYNMIGLSPADYGDGNPMVVETFFPTSYGSSELAGKTAYFEVTVIEHEEYDAPSLDETFVTDTLGLSASSLADYEGDSIVDKYIAKVRDDLEKSGTYSLDDLIYVEFMSSVLGGAVIKKYPQQQVLEAIELVKEEIEYYYKNTVYSYYYTLEQFTCIYLGLNSINADPTEALENAAKDLVKRQLVLYQIMNQEELKPGEEEYEVLLDAYLTRALEANDITADDFETVKEYEAAKQKYADDITAQAGEDYLRKEIYNEIIFEFVISCAEIAVRV